MTEHGDQAATSDEPVESGALEDAEELDRPDDDTDEDEAKDDE
jgi:hypothetical protein